MLNVFVSSTMEDLRKHREEVRKLIDALGLRYVGMDSDSWPAASRPSTKQISKYIGESDVFVALIAWLYGSRVAPGGTSYTEFEYRLAKRRKSRNGMPMLLFLSDPNRRTLPAHFARGADLESVESLRKDIEKTSLLTWKYFDTPLDLVRKLSAALVPILLKTAGAKDLSLADRLVLEIRQALYADLLARSAEITQDLTGLPLSPAPPGRTPAPTSGPGQSKQEWFIPGLARCNVGERRYIQRAKVQEQVATWLVSEGTPFLFLTGPSGIGKTNFLVDFIGHALAKRSALGSYAILMLPLGSYSPGKGFLANVLRFLSKSDRLLDQTRLRERLSALFKDGRVLLILDGLDELARNRDEAGCRVLFKEIAHDVPLHLARVIVSCRDHIYLRLRHQGWFAQVGRSEEVRVLELSVPEVRRATTERTGPRSLQSFVLNANPPLLKFARSPLLFEMMCRFSPDSWRRLIEAPTRGRLYDLWFEEIVGTGVPAPDRLKAESRDDTRGKLERVASSMLMRRSDLISREDLAKENLSPKQLQSLTRQPFGILVPQTRNEWGFVHDSFREFALARTVASELSSGRYRLLAATSSFDYVGAENYQFLRELEPASESLLDQFERAIATHSHDPNAWNNIARNCFEAVGMIGDEKAERFLDHALAILHPPADKRRRWRPWHGLASARTIYGIVRSIERLHPSAPRPYCDYVLSQAWPKEPTWDSFGACVVMGFRLREPRADYYRRMAYRLPNNTGKVPRQAKVSELLLGLLSSSLKDKDLDHQLVALNCTFALIRWLHPGHVARLKKLMARLNDRAKSTTLTPPMKGNLFLALTRLRQPDVFRGCTDMFAGMELCSVYLTKDMFPPVADFHFKRVHFLDSERNRIIGFGEKAFADCVHENRRDLHSPEAGLPDAAE